MALRWSSTHGSMDSNIRRRSEGYQHHRSAYTGSSGSPAVNSTAAKMALRGLAASFKHEFGEGAGIWNAAYAPDQAEATEAYYIRKAAKKFGKGSGVRRAASTGDVEQGRRVTWDEESIVNARYNRHTDAGDDEDDDEFEAERKSTIKAVTMANIRRSKSIAMGWLPSDIEGNNTPDSPQAMNTRLRRIGHSGMVEPTAALGSKHGIPDGLGITGFEDPAALDESSSPVDEGGDVVEEDTTPHEQRADAFDYEHFFLHSAMGHYPIDSEIEDEEEGEEGEYLSGEDEDYGEDGEGEEVIEEEEYEEDENNDRESVRTAKGNDKRNSDVSSTSTPQEAEPQGEENHPEKDNLLSIYPGNTSAVQGSSQESLSTILTFQTAPEARSNSGTPVQDSRHLGHSRNSSQRTVTAHRASPSDGSNASSNSGMQYKISTIRSASTPTVLIQPRLAGESRSSSRASDSRSHKPNQRAPPRMVDRGMQTFPWSPTWILRLRSSML
ncbi:hypothetical protein KEM55_007388 [Ascosphaera atra]|nr:hypothetical protein KEM55_007388 [Ascosphaera atra]